MLLLIRLTLASLFLFALWRETGPLVTFGAGFAYLGYELFIWERSNNDANREKIDRETTGRGA